MVGGDSVDGSIDQAGDQRITILPRCQRRIHFVVCIVANVFVGQREVMRRDLTGYFQPVFLGGANIFEGAGGGHVRDVQARAGEAGNFDVAAGANGFGLRGNSLQAQTDRTRTFAHDAAGKKRGIFAVIDNRQIQS